MPSARARGCRHSAQPGWEQGAGPPTSTLPAARAAEARVLPLLRKAPTSPGGREAAVDA